jgi:hypothetical protein
MPPSNTVHHESLCPWIVVRPEPAGQFTAQLLGLPELSATAASREEAIEQVCVRIGEWVAANQLLPVAVPAVNPLMRWFGWAKDDPEYALFREEIRRYREEVDQREPSE